MASNALPLTSLRSTNDCRDSILLISVLRDRKDRIPGSNGSERRAEEKDADDPDGADGAAEGGERSIHLRRTTWSST